MYTSVNHTSFTVSDLDRSIAFYTDVLGMKLRGTHNYRLIRCPVRTGSS